MKRSYLEIELGLQIMAKKFKDKETLEYVFHPKRKWRFDFAFIDKKIAVEIDGGIWNSGRHSRGRGIISDCDKYNSAIELGWRILRFTHNHIKSGEAIATIERILNAK